MQKKVINAGRILVVGTQGGGKTAIVTKLAARTDSSMEYQEDFAGTIETEYLKVSFDEGNFFSLLLPIGGQEKWAKLRERFGSTAEAIVAILDSCTKQFWINSLQQASSISSVLPYNNYPIAFIVTKRDLNDSITNEASTFGETIVEGITNAKREGVTYYSRGFRIAERSFQLETDTDEIPFTQMEQIIANALEQKFFTGLEPGNARKGRMLLTGFSLVNCRIFSRALTLALSQQAEPGDQLAILGLLNDMRPTMLELDTNWTDLIRKYPKAGSEPIIPADISANQIKGIILEKLLANEADIHNFEQEIAKMSHLTGWRPVGWEHISIFHQNGLDKASSLVRKIMETIRESELAEKFILFDPIEELF
ncbi:MAG: ADP-ribosylation factor-like protein [Promethearchaeota archaeon]